jgi:V8-like Glu-specific endopeptidase
MKTPRQALVVALLALSSLSSCHEAFRSAFQNESAQTGIIGGTAVDLKDPIAKVIVHIILQFPNGDLGNCTGTIISPKLILTAAHCFSSQSDGRVEASRIVLADGTEAKPAGIFVHPEYDFTKRYDRFDIALLQFEGVEVKKTAILPKAGEVAKPSFKTFVAGFGRTVADQTSDSQLNKLPAKIVNTEFTRSEQIVFNGETTGTCFGDSGGPFYMVKRGTVKVFSVLSREAPGNSGCVGSDIQTKTEPALPWIQQVVNGEISARVSAAK